MTPEPRAAGAPIGSILLAGGGKMGGALLQGWLTLDLPDTRFTVIDPQPSAALRAICAGGGVALNPAMSAGSEAPDILVLAVKPQALDDAAPALAPLATSRTLVLSVVAGKTLGDLAARLPDAGAIVRAMPNTPAAIGRGISGVVAKGTLSAARHAAVDRLLRAVGQVVWLDSEAQIDAVTAVSGSGPAYVFLLAETLATAGERVGLPPDLAARLARATVEGAGELLARHAGESPEVLRQNVTSPGGTTAAALAVLMGPRGLEPLMIEAVAAARARARDLAG